MQLRSLSSLFALSLGLTATLAAASAGTAEADATKTLGIDGGIALPTGDWGDVAGVGFGALARLEMPLQAKLTLTARAGYLQHTSQDGDQGDTSTSEIPFFGGARYTFSGGDPAGEAGKAAEIYGAAELGLVISRFSVDVEGGESMSESNTNLGMTLGAGYRTGKLDLRANLLFPDIGELGDVMGVMATVGYDLTTL